MVGAVDGYKWNITDSYDNHLNQRNNVNNKNDLEQKDTIDADDKSKTTECQTCKNRKYVDGSNERLL